MYTVKVLKNLGICFEVLSDQLKGHDNRSKYALEILGFFYQLAILSQKTASGSLYGLFVNTKGLVDTHIPADLQM